MILFITYVFLILFVIGLSLPAFSQKGKASFYKDLSLKKSVHPVIREASADIYRNFTIRDSVVYSTQTFEKAVLQGKPAGSIKPSLVRTARKKYPGSGYRAVSNRLSLYATEGKNLKRKVSRR